jgi:outer membrane protein
MKNQRFVFMTVITVVITFVISFPSSGQVNHSDSVSFSGDSLTLDKYISTVVKNHPAVKEAEEALNAADIRIKLSQSAYFPNFDASASYSRIGPVSKMDIPVFGEIQLYPENNYSAAINLHQNIYDFGRTSKDVAYQRENKNLVAISLDEARQKLSLLAIGNFYTLVYLQEALVIKNEQLNTLQEHLDFINKKKETGSATKYELLSTQVKISNVQSQLTDLSSALNTQQSVMNNLIGLPENTALAVRNEMNLKSLEIMPDSMVSQALSQRNEIRTATEKISLAELRCKIEKTKYYPVINLYASAGGKNGYYPKLNDLKFNYVAGIGLNVPIFDGTRTQNNIALAKSSLLTNQLDMEIQRRSVTNDVIENKNNVAASEKKISQFELQLTQAEQAFALAQTSYADGVITNLDLLDAATTLAECRLVLLKVKIERVISIYKLKSALGEKLY